MKKLENWILETKPEWIGLQDEVKHFIEMGAASDKVVRNGFLAYPLLNLKEVGAFFQRVMYFKRREVEFKDGSKSFKYLFGIENMTGMESGGGNFHFEIFANSLESAITYAGYDIEHPAPMPMILVYEGLQKSEKNVEYHSFKIISLVDKYESENSESDDVRIETKKSKKSVN
jgi:hypothetical protein